MDTMKQKLAIEAGWVSQSPYFRKIGQSRGLSDFETDDLCQDIAIRCLQSIGKVDWTISHDKRDALIRKIARWQLKDHCRKTIRHQNKQEPCFDLNALVAAEDNEPSTSMQRAEESSRLLAKVDLLNPRASAVLYERYFEGQSDNAIALRHHEPLNTIRTRHKRALKKLAEIFC